MEITREYDEAYSVGKRNFCNEYYWREYKDSYYYKDTCCSYDYRDCCDWSCRSDLCYDNMPCWPVPAKKKGNALQVQLEGRSLVEVKSGEKIIFDKVITQLSKEIQYNYSTGEILILKQGTYYIEWWVATESISGGTQLYTQFSLTSSRGQSVSSSNGNTWGQVVGSTVLNFSENMPVTISLINTTDGNIAFGQVPIKANLTIMKSESN